MNFPCLRDRGVAHGHIIVNFYKPISDTERHRAAEAIDNICVPMAPHLSLMSCPLGWHLGGTFLADSRDAGAGQLV